MPDDWELNDDLLREEVFFVDVLLPWEMFFDGATRWDGVGARVVLISPEKHILRLFLHPGLLMLNNVAEYQALILGLQMAIGME